MIDNLINHLFQNCQNFNITLFCIVLGLWIALKIFADYGYIMEISWLWHSAEASIRLMLGSYLSYLVLGTGTFSLVFFSFYWLTFDLGLNIIRGKKALYVGQNSGIDMTFTMIGILLEKKPGLIMLITKIIALSISALIFYFRFQPFHV